MADTVNTETGEVVETSLVTVIQPEMALSRAPQLVLDDAKAAAKALVKVLDAKPKKVIVNGKQYLEFDDWQVLARFYGVTAKVTDTNPVEFAGVRGFEARAVALYRGQEISAAESMCLSDEERWGKRPLFQLRSMAQTRACAKVLRNVLSFVPVMAGYAPTPAEEMDGEREQGETRQASGGREPYKRNRAGGSGKTITDKQRTFLFAQMKEAKVEPVTVLEWVKKHLKVEKSEQIKMDDFQKLLHFVNPKKFELEDTGKPAEKTEAPPAQEGGEPEADLFPGEDDAPEPGSEG